MILQLNEAAAFQSKFPQAPGAVEQVQMGHSLKRMDNAGHAKASFEQRLIERFAPSVTEPARYQLVRVHRDLRLASDTGRDCPEVAEAAK